MKADTEKKVPQLKDPSHAIFIGGQEIRNHNMTQELYDWLIEQSPAHKELFIQDEDAPKEPTPSAKPPKIREGS